MKAIEHNNARGRESISLLQRKTRPHIRENRIAGRIRAVIRLEPNSLNAAASKYQASGVKGRKMSRYKTSPSNIRWLTWTISPSSAGKYPFFQMSDWKTRLRSTMITNETNVVLFERVLSSDVRVFVISDAPIRSYRPSPSRNVR